MCEEMVIPCLCQHCGEIFDLHDGSASEKWYLNIVICEKCGDLEDREVETNNELSEIIEELENALYTASEKYPELDELLEKREEMGVVKERILPGITKQKLLDNGWVIDESNPLHPISKDLVDRSQLTEDDDPKDYVCSLLYSQLN
jgi:hypothetical protein